MDGSRIRLMRVRGIPIYLDLSWFLVFALMTLTLGQFFRLAAPDLSSGHVWGMAVFAALAFFACIVLHELGHALVGRANGMPFRGITLFLFGGVAELEKEPPSARAELLMAGAGPAVSAVLALAFWLGASASASWGGPVQATLVLSYLASINLLVLLFNLVPAFPLDGGRIFRALSWWGTGDLRRSTLWAAIGGRAFGWVLILFGVLQFFAGAWVTGVWLGILGLFLTGAARNSYAQVVAREALEGEPITRFMSTEPVVVSPDLDLKHWVDDYVYRYFRKTFPVAADGKLTGIVNTQALERFPREEWDRHRVAEVMQGDVANLCITTRTDALEALERMKQTGSHRLLVVDEGKLVGVVSLRDLMHFLDLKMTVEGAAR